MIFIVKETTTTTPPPQWPYVTELWEWRCSKLTMQRALNAGTPQPAEQKQGNKPSHMHPLHYLLLKKDEFTRKEESIFIRAAQNSEEL